MWEKAFSQAPGYQRKGRRKSQPVHLSTIEELKEFIDYEHIKHCLLKPYFQVKDYPLVEARELLPSFEVDLYEHKSLPGFAMVAFERQLNGPLLHDGILHGPFCWNWSGRMSWPTTPRAGSPSRACTPRCRPTWTAS